MTNPFADELANFSKSKLKPTETRISYASGRTFIKSSGSNEEREMVYNEATTTKTDESSSVYWSRHLGYLVDLKPDLSIDEIVPRVFLSGDDVAENRNLLRQNNITHVLNLTSNVANKFEDDEIKYKTIIIYDLPQQDIGKYFEEAFQFIDEALFNQTCAVLVHCNAGTRRN